MMISLGAICCRDMFCASRKSGTRRGGWIYRHKMCTHGWLLWLWKDLSWHWEGHFLFLAQTSTPQLVGAIFVAAYFLVSLDEHLVALAIEACPQVGVVRARDHKPLT